MPENKVYIVEALRTFTRAEYRPDVMKERTVEAWEFVGTIHSSDNMWTLFEPWFQALPDHEKTATRWRLIDPASGHAGGYFYEWTTSPSWSVRESPPPKQEEPVLAAIDSVA